MKYEELLGFSDEELLTYTNSVEGEVNKTKIQQIAELRREIKLKESALKSIVVSMSNPEDTPKLVDITKTIARTILDSEITDTNIKEEPFKHLNEQDLDFYNGRRYRPVHDLHRKVTQDDEVSGGLVKLKETGKLNSQTQWRKKKPNDWLSSLAVAKMEACNAASLRALEERMARMELAQKENEGKFEQIGSALLNQERKLKALSVLGVDKKKLHAYRLSIENPELSVDEIALRLGKHRATVFRWIKEIKDLKDETEG